MTLIPASVRACAEKLHVAVQQAKACQERYGIKDEKSKKWVIDMEALTKKAVTTHRELVILALMIKHQKNDTLLNSKMATELANAKKTTPVPRCDDTLHKKILAWMEAAKHQKPLV